MTDTKHTRISSVLLDNTGLDDDSIWKIVCHRFGTSYSKDKWEKDMEWNCRFIYTAICVLQRLEQHGHPTTNAQSVISAWCKNRQNKWLAELFLSRLTSSC